MKRAFFILLLMIFLFISSGNADSAELKANAAKVDLTPPLEMKFILGGYGARMSKPAEGIHDRVWAKALVLSDGEKKYAIITIDILALPPNVKPQVIEKLAGAGWTVENVMFLPSHSHTGLNMSALNNKNILNLPQIGIFHPELLDFVVDKLTDVIKLADQNLQPVAVGTARLVVEGMNRNRRGAGLSDKDLTVTRIDLKNGKPLAVLVNWTAHPTLVDENDMWLSGAWPGYLQRELEAWIGDGIICMYHNGAEGDQAPVRPPGGSHYEQAEIYGRSIAIKAFEAFNRIEPQNNVTFAYNYTLLTLPKRVAHPMYHKTGGDEYGLTDKVMEVILKTMSPEKAGIGAVRIGELMITGVPGEMIYELGLQVKNKLAQAGIKYPVIGGIADEWISYILSADQYNEGGYEASVSFYGPHLGETLVQGMINVAMPLALAKGE